MKIYIAARYTQKEFGQHIRRDLQSLGHEVTSGWLDEVDDAPRAAALRDVADVARADAVLLLSAVTDGGKGMWVEAGIAIALGKKIFVYPTFETVRSCVFMHLDQVKFVQHLSDIQ